MEKRKILDIVKRVVIFVLGVSFLVGSFFLGAYHERTKSNLLSASADNGYYDGSGFAEGGSNSSAIVSDLFPYDYISIMTGAPLDLSSYDRWYNMRFLFDSNYTFTVKTGDIQGDPNNRWYVAWDQNFLITEHVRIYDSRYPSNDQNSSPFTYLSCDWNNHVIEDPNIQYELPRNSDLFSFMSSNILACLFSTQMSCVLPDTGSCLSVELGYSDIVLPAYNKQGLTNYGLPSIGWRREVPYILSTYNYTGRYRTSEDSEWLTLSISGSAPDFDISPSYNRINFIYDLLNYLNNLHPNAEAYWFSDLSYSVSANASQYGLGINRPFNLFYYTTLIEPDYNLKNISQYESYFNLVSSETIIVPGGELAPTDWLGDTVKGVFDAEIFSGFTLGGLFLIIIGVPIVIWILKLFAGG